MSTPIGIVCIDDNADVCAAIRSYVTDRPAYHWLGQHDRGDGAVEVVLAAMPSIVVLDIDMPGRPSIEVLEEIAASIGDVRVIVFSGHCKRALIERALDGGAWGYVSKNDGEDVLFDAIQRVMRGEIVLSAEASVALLIGRG